MTKKQDVRTINIKGKEYVPVDERVRLAHEEFGNNLSITTELIPTDDDRVLFKATVSIKTGESLGQFATFTGWSASNKAKMIERENPYEVAETSAVGRALGFAGFGLVGSIASADEIQKAVSQGSQGLKTPSFEQGTRANHGGKCAYDGKYCAPEVVEWCHDKLGLAVPLCRDCQQHPERIEAFKNTKAEEGDLFHDDTNA